MGAWLPLIGFVLYVFFYWHFYLCK